jgi:hypothetical protein
MPSYRLKLQCILIPDYWVKLLAYFTVMCPSDALPEARLAVHIIGVAQTCYRRASSKNHSLGVSALTWHLASQASSCELKLQCKAEPRGGAPLSEKAASLLCKQSCIKRSNSLGFFYQVIRLGQLAIRSNNPSRTIFPLLLRIENAARIRFSNRVDVYRCSRLTPTDPTRFYYRMPSYPPSLKMHCRISASFVKICSPHNVYFESSIWVVAILRMVARTCQTPEKIAANQIAQSSRICFKFPQILLCSALQEFFAQSFGTPSRNE